VSERSNHFTEIHFSDVLAARHYPVRGRANEAGVAGVRGRLVLHRLLSIVLDELSENHETEILREKDAGLRGIGSGLLPSLF